MATTSTDRATDDDDLDQPPPSLVPPNSAPKYSAPSSRSITPQPQPPTDDPRPLILCLHGGGSTATVFKIQSRRLIWSLSAQFRFIFADAPHPGDPGFGMLPVFASCAPFRRWVTRRWRLGEGDVELTSPEEVDMVDAVLDACVARETGMSIEDVRSGTGTGSGSGGGWDRVVGVMGFSQGARLVPGLLLRQKLLERAGRESRWKLKFGIIIGGPYPPISLPPPSLDEHENNNNNVDVNTNTTDYSLLQTIPTVHAWGTDDHVKSGCLALQDACEGDTCFQMEFEGGHHMPLRDVEAKDLCDLIMAAWFAGGGTREVAWGEKY